MSTVPIERSAINVPRVLLSARCCPAYITSPRFWLRPRFVTTTDCQFAGQGLIGLTRCLACASEFAFSHDVTRRIGSSVGLAACHSVRSARNALSLRRIDVWCALSLACSSASLRCEVLNFRSMIILYHGLGGARQNNARIGNKKIGRNRDGSDPVAQRDPTLYNHRLNNIECRCFGSPSFSNRPLHIILNAS